MVEATLKVSCFAGEPGDKVIVVPAEYISAVGDCETVIVEGDKLAIEPKRATLELKANKFLLIRTIGWKQDWERVLYFLDGDKLIFDKAKKS